MNELQYVARSVDVGVLTGFLNSLASFSNDLVQHLHSGQKLCHYTDLGGAIGIVSGADLWLTNSRYSNDHDEQVYGQRLVDELIVELEGTGATSVPSRAWLARVREALRAGHGDDVYVCSFCESDNLLSQWRGYGENGGGVCLEFDPAGFAAAAGTECEDGLMRLWRVFYDRAQQREIVRACLEFPYWPNADDEGERLRYVVDALQFFMPTFKNCDFKEEQERRLVFTPGGSAATKLKFRSRRGLIVPYFSLRELSPNGFSLPIKHLLIGPSDARALNVHSGRMLLKKYGYGDVPVAASQTPYRG